MYSLHPLVCVLIILAAAVLICGQQFVDENDPEFLKQVYEHETRFKVAKLPSDATPVLSPKRRKKIVEYMVEVTNSSWEAVTEVRYTTGKFQYALSNERMVQDGVISQQDCLDVIRAVNGAIQKKMDGQDFAYDAFKEVFNGVSFHELFASPDFFPSTKDKRALLFAKESARYSAQRYFNLSSLYVDLTHFTRRNRRPDDAPPKWEHQQGLAHGVHADNCQHRDHGDCVKIPAHCCHWRDYSSILYLNGPDEFVDEGVESFTGGEFFFDDQLIDEPGVIRRTIVPPKCGRLVAFTSGRENTHGVLNIEGPGYRFALPNWLTVDAAHDENFGTFVDDEDVAAVMAERKRRLEEEKIQELHDEL